MTNLARAVALQTRLLEDALLPDRGLSFDLAVPAVMPLEQLAAFLTDGDTDQLPLEMVENLFQLLAAGDLVARDGSAVLETGGLGSALAPELWRGATWDREEAEGVTAFRRTVQLRGGRRLPDLVVHAPVEPASGSSAAWLDLGDAVTVYRPPALGRRIADCQAHYDRAGGRSKAMEAEHALRWFNGVLDRYKAGWQELWCEHQPLLQPAQILIFVLKRARDAQWQLAADFTLKMLREGKLIGRSLDRSGALRGWNSWPPEEWRQYAIEIVQGEDAPTLEVVSNDRSIRIPADQVQLGRPELLAVAPVATGSKGKGGRPVNVRWADAAARLVAWLAEHGEPIERGEQAAAVRFIQDGFPEADCPSDSELKKLVRLASEALTEIKRAGRKG